MKKLLIFLILILFACPPAFGQTIIIAKKKAATCSTQALPNDMGTVGGIRTGIFTWWTYITSEFIAGESTNICKICLNLAAKTETSPDWTLTAYLYSNNTSSPNAVLENGTYGTLASSTLTTTAGWYCFDGGSAALTADTHYHVVLKSSGYANGGENYLTIGVDVTTATENIRYSANGSTWSSWFTDHSLALTLWK